MPAPFSPDLRTRILAALAAGHPVSVVAERFAVAPRTVRRYRQLWRETGSLTAGHSSGRPRRIPAEQEAQLRQLVTAEPDATLVDYCHRWQELTGTWLSPATMCRTLHRLRLPRKKSGWSPVNRTRRTVSSGGR